MTAIDCQKHARTNLYVQVFVRTVHLAACSRHRSGIKGFSEDFINAAQQGSRFRAWGLGFRE